MLPYIAAGFGLGFLLFPWFSPAEGLLSLPEEAGRQILLLGVTAFVAAKLKTALTFKRVPLWLPALVATIACLMIGRTILLHTPFVPGDEDEYFFQAQIFAKGQIAAPAPDPAAPFWAPGMLVHHGKWFGHHQPGHSLFLSWGLLLGAPYLIPALFTGLVVLLIARTARHMGGADAGVFASLLAMTSPMLLLTGSTLVSETSSLLFASLIFWLLIENPRGKARSTILAGVALGILLNIRLLTGFGVACAALILTRRGDLKRLAPGITAGILFLLFHNQLLTGKPWIFPFQLYEPGAIGFRPRFGPMQSLAHLIRNGLLLNFWLLGWPISLILLKQGGKKLPRPVARASGMFILFLVVGYFFYWHPGQVATGPLRLYEAVFPLLVISALGWARCASNGTFLSRYVPLAIGAACLGFLPVRMAVLSDFLRVHQEERLSLQRLHLDDCAVILCGKGNLFHYPINDPWLRKNKPVFLRTDNPAIPARLFPDKTKIRLEAGCEADTCWWRMRPIPNIPPKKTSSRTSLATPKLSDEGGSRTSFSCTNT